MDCPGSQSDSETTDDGRSEEEMRERGTSAGSIGKQPEVGRLPPQSPVLRGLLKRPYVKRLKHGRKDTLGGPRSKCPHCPFSAVNSYSLKIHLRHHSSNSGLRCHLCTYSVSSQIVLSRHINRVHPEEARQELDNEYEDMEQLDRDVRAGFEALKAAAAQGPKKEANGAELMGELIGRKEAVERRLAEWPESKMKTEIGLRKLQCAALEMKMWLLQQSPEQKEPAQAMIGAGEDLIRQTEGAIQALDEEKALLEGEKEDLLQQIRSIQDNLIGSGPSKPSIKELVEGQRCRILRYYGAKQRKARQAFLATSNLIHQEQEESLESLDHLLEAD